MPRRPPDADPEIVSGDLTEQQLEAYLRSPELAVDTETMGLHTLRDRLCLIQLFDRADNACIVQIGRREGPVSSPAPPGLAPRLKRLLEEPSVLKVFHFARFDVAALKHHLAIDVAPIYCTRTVSKLVRTYTDRHGLKDNLREFLGVELDKEMRNSDWSATTLRPDQVRYAISDVTLLLQLKDKLDELLQREGGKELAERCFDVIPTLARLDLRGYDLLFEH